MQGSLCVSPTLAQKHLGTEEEGPGHVGLHAGLHAGSHAGSHTGSHAGSQVPFWFPKTVHCCWSLDSR